MFSSLDWLLLNSLDSCQDGPWGTYHSDESIDKVVVRSGDINAPSNDNMVEGGRATIEASVWAWNTVRIFLYSRKQLLFWISSH